MLVIMENQLAINILGSQNAPNITRLCQTYPIATRYFAATHPSLPNYLTLWAGSTFAISDDGLPVDHRLTGQTLGSQLDALQISWTAYFESFADGQDPTVGGGGADSAGNAADCVDHNPVVYFSDFDRSKVKPFVELLLDLGSAVPPQFCLVVPNMANNMHDPVGSTFADSTAVRAGDTWSQELLDAIRAAPWWQQGGTVMLV